MRWHCPPDTRFEIRALAVWGRARYFSVTEAPHNTSFYTRMGKKHFFFPPRLGTELRTLAWKAALLTTTLGPPTLISSNRRLTVSLKTWSARHGDMYITAQAHLSRSGRIFVIVVVHIQCSKLFKGMECTVMPMVLCTIKNPWSHSK